MSVSSPSFVTCHRIPLAGNLNQIISNPASSCIHIGLNNSEPRIRIADYGSQIALRFVGSVHRRQFNTDMQVHSSRIRQSFHCLAAQSGDGDREVEGITRRKPIAERSESANEELLLFFFQLDLTTRLQRALNQDAYEVAQQLREKIAEVEQEVARQRAAKMGSASSKDEAQDKAITLLQLKSELQKLIEEEDYTRATTVRNKITALEAESLAAQAKALVFQQLNFQFRLGQKIRHKIHGYRGVVCGMDPLCCESSNWADAAGVNELPRGPNQPFYQVLVDVREEPSLMVSYVAEENLCCPEEPDLDTFDHPYVYFLFYGMDKAGDFIVCKQLREKYNQPRHELPHEEEGDAPSSA
jgi:hemimethylated DNA binding protein